MTEIVKIGTAEMRLQDCMEYMRGLPDKAFDLAIVDPPYGIGIGSVVGGGGKAFGGGGIVPPTVFKAFDDSRIPEKDYFSQLERVSRNRIIWGGNYFAEHLGNSSCWIVWDKDNSGNFADCELAFTSYKTAVRKFKYRWNGMLQENMANKETRIHPTQKPIKLYEWLLTNYAKPGQRILDTHLGSMSSVIACLNMGFEIVGCELDADYFKSGVERVMDSQKQQKLDI